MVLDEPKDDDESCEFGGLTFLINKELSAQSGAVKVDFIDSGWQQGFTLTSEKPLTSPGMDSGGCGGSCSC